MKKIRNQHPEQKEESTGKGPEAEISLTVCVP